MNSKETLSAVVGQLASVAKTRGAVASILQRPEATVDEIGAARAQLNAAAGVLDEAEAGLKAIERGLIVRADDAGNAEREARLVEIATNQTRLGVMLEEVEARRVAAQQKLDHANLRAVAVAKRKELGDLLKTLADAPAIVQRLECHIEASDQANFLLTYLERMAAAHPTINEFRIEIPSGLNFVRQEITRLKIAYQL